MNHDAGSIVDNWNACIEAISGCIYWKLEKTFLQLP